MGDAREDRPGADPDFARRLLDANPDGLWLFDDEGVTIWANDRMAHLLGRDPAEMVGLRAHDTLDEQGRADFEQHLATMVATGEGRDNFEACLVRPDGTATWGLVSFAPLVDDDGHRVGWLHRVTPYTERKELVEALLEREQQLATAQRIAHLGSWEWDVAADRVTWSDELCRIFDLAPGSELTYASYLQRVHPDDRAVAEEAVQRAFADGQPYTFDHRVLRGEDDVRWVRGRGVVDRDADGQVVRMSGTALDVTDVRLADQQAADATRRLNLLQQMTTAANRATSLREALLVAGAGVPEHTSWTATCAYLYDVPDGPELLDLGGATRGIEPDAELALAARESGELQVGTPTSLPSTHSLIAMPVLRGDEVVCVVELVADEVAPDDDSHRLMAQVAAQLGIVAQRERAAIELGEARDAAMEASRLKSEFLATMSHEIRTPMNGVIGLTELLLRTDLDDHQHRLAQNLQSAGMTLLGIINDILDLSKIESGKLELEAADFEVRTVFDQVATLLSGPAHERGLELVVACHPDVPAQLRGDAVRLGQVLNNLGSNALKFTDSGEVVIEARVERQTARETVVRVDVTDTGVGIEPEARERLFDAFVQADPSTTRRHGGTGLGLAISRQLVAALGGELGVTSEPGAGSTFSFTARFGRATVTPDPLEPAVDELRGRRALVVDDNATVRRILAEQLAAWEMRVIAVPSAVEALAELRDGATAGEPFTLMLLDLQMPGVDGLELARMVSIEEVPQPATLLLSSDDVDNQTLAAAGIDACLAKPVRHAELLEGLLDLLAPHHVREATAPSTLPSLDIRVLVVDDNPVNQLVATGLLEDLGCTVEVADDGLEAVERLASGEDYDVVLMDCRMPRMDGFDATRRIREQEPAGTHVPIVAMTASAFEGEREHCFEAGMDDFLTKPVDVAEVARALQVWADHPGSPAASRRTGEAPREARAVGGVLDDDRVRVLDGIVKDGTSFFERTAASFLGRVGEQVGAIRSAVEAEDPGALLNAAHQLKGSALNLGLPRVAAVSARLEALGAEGTTDGGLALLDDLAAEVAVAVSALQRATAPDA